MDSVVDIEADRATEEATIIIRAAKTKITKKADIITAGVTIVAEATTTTTKAEEAKVVVVAVTTMAEASTDVSHATVNSTAEAVEVAAIMADAANTLEAVAAITEVKKTKKVISRLYLGKESSNYHPHDEFKKHKL